MVAALRFLKEINLLSDLKLLAKKFLSYETLQLMAVAESYANCGIPSVLKLLPTIASKEGVFMVGQLAMKEEAAGKIRVFALVDVWTQSVLKPLHEFLFDILRSLPNDATFDRISSEKRCVVKVASSGVSYGYDLSAATDRLPLRLQESIISQLFGKEIGSA
jgi:hypothetical protein